MVKENKKGSKWWIPYIIVPLGIAIIAGGGLTFVVDNLVPRLSPASRGNTLLLTGTLAAILVVILALMFFIGIVMIVIQIVRKFQHKSANWIPAAAFTLAFPVYLGIGVTLHDVIKIQNNLPHSWSGTSDLYANLITAIIPELICIGIAIYMCIKR